LSDEAKEAIVKKALANALKQDSEKNKPKAPAKEAVKPQPVVA